MNFNSLIISYSMSKSQLKPLVNSIFTNIDKNIEEVGFLKSINKKFGIRPSHLFLIVLGIVLVLSMLSVFAKIITNVFGMIYPAYMSWKAIEKNNEEQKKIWLTYWIVFGLLSTIDDTFGFILEFIPGFYTLRFVVYVWMFYPRANNGATIIYKAIKPILVMVTSKIDELASKKAEKKA